MKLQKNVNALAMKIAKSMNEKFSLRQRPDGSIDCLVKSCQLGDIGLCTENQEITVYGFECHQHFWSSTNEFDEIVAMEPQIQSLILGLLNGTIIGYGIFREDMTPLSGGFGCAKNGKYHVRRLYDSAAIITIRTLDVCEITLSAKDVIVEGAGQ